MLWCAAFMSNMFPIQLLAYDHRFIIIIIVLCSLLNIVHVLLYLLYYKQSNYLSLFQVVVLGIGR